jgi:hypothetical protein
LPLLPPFPVPPAPGAPPRLGEVERCCCCRHVCSAEPVKPSHDVAPRFAPALLPSLDPPYAPLPLAPGVPLAALPEDPRVVSAANDTAERLSDIAAAAIIHCCLVIIKSPSSRVEKYAKFRVCHAKQTVCRNQRCGRILTPRNRTPRVASRRVV